jgi:branched-chain amino acid transport system permease protein
MLGAMLLCGTLGFLIDWLVLKPLRLRHAPHLIPMIATIGVSIMLTTTAQGLFGAEAMRFPEETLPAGEFVVGDVHVRALEVAIVLISFILMAVMFTILKRTQIGRALRAISESPKAAWLLGIPVERLFHATSFVAAALGGVAGVLIALDFNAITPGMGQPMLHKGIAVIILGGMGDIRGALIGGLFLGFAEVISKAYLSSQMGDAVAFGLLFLILLVRPSGLFGRQLERKA